MLLLLLIHDYLVWAQNESIERKKFLASEDLIFNLKLSCVPISDDDEEQFFINLFCYDDESVYTLRDKRKYSSCQVQ